MSEEDDFSCSATGLHWEKIGFQGLDPSTDVNRSMKMFAVLQLLHLVESDYPFASRLHHLSGSAEASYGRHTASTDQSWPFFCVSIMFTKEAIQALRSGLLNKKINKYQSVLRVINDFHHACFYDFAK